MFIFHSVRLSLSVVVAIKSLSGTQVFCHPTDHRPPHGAHQAPLSMGFCRQGYWSGLAFPSPGELPDPGIEPESPALAGGFFTTEQPGKPVFENRIFIILCYDMGVTVKMLGATESFSNHFLEIYPKVTELKHELHIFWMNYIFLSKKIYPNLLGCFL